MISVSIHDDAEFIADQHACGRGCGGTEKVMKLLYVCVRFMRMVNAAANGCIINGSGVQHPSTLYTVDTYKHITGLCCVGKRYSDSEFNRNISFQKTMTPFSNNFYPLTKNRGQWLSTVTWTYWNWTFKYYIYIFYHHKIFLTSLTYWILTWDP